MFHHYLTVCSLKREGDGQGGENPDRKRRAEKKKKKDFQIEFRVPDKKKKKGGGEKSTAK